MIKLEQIKLPLGYSDATLARACATRLGVNVSELRGVKLLKRSVDARHKPDLGYIVSAAVEVSETVERRLVRKGSKLYAPTAELIEQLRLPSSTRRVAVVGSGPAGLFAALALAQAGARPIVIERGADVDTRLCAINRLRTQGILDPETNVQFGEGGAGTFSDGKLNTGTTSEFTSVVLGEFVRHGAPEEIRWLNKPHIGTDYLARVVKSMRFEIEASGGRYLFGTRAVGFEIRGGRLVGIRTEGAHTGVIECDACVLAIGHSARDTYRMLHASGIVMAPKPFAVGVRAEHRQSAIDFAQYGTETPPRAADYKLATRLDDGTGVFTFCMCPGGEVVCSSSEAGGIVTNGMSEWARAGDNANAAVLVGVDAADFGEELFGGMEFQSRLERAAYRMSSSYAAPAQRYEDFVRGRVSAAWGSVAPTYRPAPVFADLNALLPVRIAGAIKEGIRLFGRKLVGYDAADTVLTGPETRSSAPLRIVRGDDGQSSLAGLYPAGEGAGYAGGITSAAVDGLRAAIRILGGRA